MTVFVGHMDGIMPRWANVRITVYVGKFWTGEQRGHRWWECYSPFTGDLLWTIIDP